MRNVFRRALRYLLLLGALWCGATDARADILARFTGTTPVGGNTEFNYDLVLTNGQGIGRGAPSELITIYDIPGYVPGSASVGLFGGHLIATTSTQLLGITPVSATVTDNPRLFNVTASFDLDAESSYGSCIDPGGCVMATMSFISTFSGLNPSGRFAAQAFEGVFFPGAFTTNQGTVTIPVGPGRSHSTMIVYVTGQRLYYDTFVAVELLPMEGPFQLLTDGTTEFGPGDPGYLGGRWWEDLNGNGVQDEDDHYFLCPLLPPGRWTP